MRIYICFMYMCVRVCVRVRQSYSSPIRARFIIEVGPNRAGIGSD